MEITKSKRIFKYNGGTLPDIPGLSADQVLATHAIANPSLKDAKLDGPVIDDRGNQVHTVKARSLGAKG